MASHRPRPPPPPPETAGVSSGSRYSGTSVAAVTTSAGPSSPGDISAATRRHHFIRYFSNVGGQWESSGIARWGGGDTGAMPNFW